MPIPTTQCVFCQQTVNKRATLSVEELGLGEGRACRTHPEVQQALAAFKDSKEKQKLYVAATASIKFIGMAAAVRVMHTFWGWPLELIYARLSARGISKAELARVEEEVTKMGGPLMSAQDMINSLAMVQKINS